MEEVIPLLYRAALRSLFASLQQYISKKNGCKRKIIRLRLNETYLDGLADPMWPMDTECQYLGAHCCLALVLLPLLELDQ